MEVRWLGSVLVPEHGGEAAGPVSLNRSEAASITEMCTDATQTSSVGICISNDTSRHPCI